MSEGKIWTDYESIWLIEMHLLDVQTHTALLPSAKQERLHLGRQPFFLHFQAGFCSRKPSSAFAYGAVNYQIYSQVILLPYEIFFRRPELQ